MRASLIGLLLVIIGTMVAIAFPLLDSGESVDIPPLWYAGLVIGCAAVLTGILFSTHAWRTLRRSRSHP